MRLTQRLALRMPVVSPSRGMSRPVLRSCSEGGKVEETNTRTVRAR
jgi:hypothetical protein